MRVDCQRHNKTLVLRECHDVSRLWLVVGVAIGQAELRNAGRCSISHAILLGLSMECICFGKCSDVPVYHSADAVASLNRPCSNIA